MRADLQNISFCYNHNRPLFNGLTLKIESQRSVGILGPSGCGKSTLLRVICGLLPNSPTHLLSGTVLLDGNAPAAAIAKGQIGFVFQEPTLLPHLTVKGNVALPLAMLGKKSRHDDPTPDLLSLVGLADRADSLPHQLSTGMKTRVMLARAFSTKPALLLMDEAFASLDIAWRLRLYADLEALRCTSAVTTVIVSHDIQEVLLLSDEIIVLSSDGEMRAHAIIDGPRLNSFDLPAVTSHLERVQPYYAELLELFLGEQREFSLVTLL